ncbi:PAXIP1 associated glutamate-rich protein 1 [Chamberlinius hualienensis]
MSENKNSKLEDDIVIECSDEEGYGGSSCNGLWHPPPEDIINLYERLDKNGTLEISWKCPGRRVPTPPPEKVDKWQEESAKVAELEKAPTEFDFDDLFGESSGGNSKITPRRTPGSRALKGSGQKRVASFKNVMSDIRRQMKLEQMDKTSAKSAKEKKGSKTGGSFRA